MIRHGIGHEPDDVIWLPHWPERANFHAHFIENDRGTLAAFLKWNYKRGYSHLVKNTYYILTMGVEPRTFS